MSKTSTVKGQRLTAQGIVKRIFQIREIVILLLVLLLAGFMALNHPQFMSMPNMRIICNYMATIRSEAPISSGISEETMITPMPSLAN